MLANTRPLRAILPLLWACGAPAATGGQAAVAPLAGPPLAGPTALPGTSGETDSASEQPPTQFLSDPTVNPATATPMVVSKPKDTRTPASIQAAITKHRPAMRNCYEEALKTNPGIAGDLVIKFVIRPDGSLKEAEVNWAESDIHVPELETCALAAVQAIKFPASSRGMESRIHYPYNFHPGH